MKPPARSAVAVPRSGIREVLDLALARGDVGDLEMGEPDFQTPDQSGAGLGRLSPSTTAPMLEAGIDRLGRAVTAWRAELAVGAGS